MDQTVAARSAVAAAAERLSCASDSTTPVTPVRDLLGDSDVALAYKVQDLLTARRLAGGARITGRKIGLTSKAVQRQLGVDQPDFGVLFDDMTVANRGTVEVSRLIAPKVEAEVAFVLNADLDAETDVRTAAAAVEYAVAALEIVDSRVVNWDICITDTVADNASSARYVLGDAQVALSEFIPAEVTMSLYKDGKQVSTGTGAACLSDPLEALAWLARTAAGFGSPLRAGDLVLSGALGPMVAVEAGNAIRTELSTLGRVAVTFV